MPVLINQLPLSQRPDLPQPCGLRCNASGPIVGAMLALAAVAAQDAADVITIDNFTFTPPELTVAVGTTVKWVNHDDIPHTVVNKDNDLPVEGARH